MTRKKLARMLLVGALLAGAGCAAGEIKAQNRAVNDENRQVYEVYRSYMNALNKQREMSGMFPQPVMSYEQWQKSPGTD